MEINIERLIPEREDGMIRMLMHAGQLDSEA